jgi:hypothetical protein
VILLLFIMRLAANLMTPFCAPGTSGEVWLEIQGDTNEVSVNAVCAKPVRLFNSFEDPWK